MRIKWNSFCKGKTNIKNYFVENSTVFFLNNSVVSSKRPTLLVQKGGSLTNTCTLILTSWLPPKLMKFRVANFKRRVPLTNKSISDKINDPI